MPNEQAILKKLRAICRALPKASETVTFGHPTFQVAKKTFCVLEEYKGELCIVFKAELPAQQSLIKSPRFFTAPYIGKHGWVSLRCSSALDWKEIKDLVVESRRLVAKKTTPANAKSKTPTKARSRTKARTRRS
jgi:predicted DNA-binding protein (MmcQ/YjbR family)